LFLEFSQFSITLSIYFKASESDPNKYFNGYVNTFLKLKLESTGYPSNVKTALEKDEYIEEINQRENIQLDPKNIKKNPQMKTISKLFLNSLYGYYITILKQKCINFYKIMILENLVKIPRKTIIKL